MSQSLVVSDLEIAIASPSFASLFLIGCCAFSSRSKDECGGFGPAGMSSKRFTLASLFEKHYNEFSLSTVWSMNQCFCEAA